MDAALRDAGIVFMFAPLMHPAMRHVGPVRRELGVQTVMNMVGPLANPANAGRQVVGVSDARRLALIAGALRELDTVHALVVHGAGMDEISPFAETQVVEIRDGAMSEWTIDPKRYGFGGGSADEIAGGPPPQNAATVVRVLRGEGNEPSTAAVRAERRRGVLCRRQDQTASTKGVDGARTTRSRRASGLVALERLREAFAARTRSLVPPHHPDDDSLNRDVVLVDVDRLHRLVRRLETDATVALAIVLLDRGRRAVHERDDHLAVVGALALVDDDEVAVADLLVDHRVAADAKHVVAAASADERLGNARRSRCSSASIGIPAATRSEQRKLDRPRRRLARQDLDGATLIVAALDVALALEIGEVLVHRRQRVVAEILRDLLEARREAVLLGVRP